MAKSQRVNFLLDKEVTKELQTLVPAGQRSKVVNLAIKKELARIKRQTATEKLLKLRQEGPKLSLIEIVKSLKSDRERR
jgi:hypothetical protein